MTIRKSVLVLTAGLFGALLLAAPSFAAEGPNLPPAEYKPLPEGTRVNYSSWGYIVKRSEGFDAAIKENNGNKFILPYAVFGRQGTGVSTLYSHAESATAEGPWETFFEDKSKSALQSLWPLSVGKKAEFEFNESYTSNYAVGERTWHMTLEVVGTELLELGGLLYPTYVVQSHVSSKNPEIDYVITQDSERLETYWYNPDSGLVLKFKREWIRGKPFGSKDDYSFVKVNFPKGTTTHVLTGTPAPGEAGMSLKAEAITLPPAPYKALLVGTKIKYDDRIYRVTKSDGFLNTYRSITGEKLSYLNVYALFGEYAENLFVTHNFVSSVPYDIDGENRKKLKAFWPLEVGKQISYELNEKAAYELPGQIWKIALKVARAETIHLKGKDYKTYVIEEKGTAEVGSSFFGHKWYDPATGLIIKAERKWTKAVNMTGGLAYLKTSNFSEGEVDNYTMVRVRFPEVAVAAKQDSKKTPAVSATDAAHLKQAAEKARAEVARKARAQEIARLERKAEEKRKADEEARKARAQELARLERKAEEKRKADEEARKARAQEITRLEREAEENRQAEAAREARETEIARLKKETEEARKAREAAISQASAAETARLKREAETTRKAREARKTEIARLKKEAEEEKVRNAEITRLKQEAEEFQKALAERDALDAKEEKARKVEIARLKQEAEEFQKAMAKRDALEAKAEKAREVEIASLRQQLEEALKARKTAEAPKAKAKTTDVFAGIEFGNYHALVIGINNYINLPKLTTAINDAEGVSRILKDEYGFKVTTLIDPDRLDIIDAFDELQEILTEEDNLLIYYAGHGWLNEEVDRGYWLPVDAKPGRRGRWISNATITDTLKGLSAKHVMVVADSCYSGTLTRAVDMSTRKRTGDYWKKMASKWARVAITSGGLEPVADKGGGKNSPFAKAFIDALNDNRSVMDGMQLFGKMRRPVMVATDQTPQYSDVRKAGHDGGDFLFVRKK